MIAHRHRASARWSLLLVALTCSLTRGVNAAAITRADVARVYLQFERAYFDRIAADEKLTEPSAKLDVAAVNREFDRLSLRFFMGDFAAVADGLTDLTVAVSSMPKPATTADFVAYKLRCEFDPPVYNRTQLDHPSFLDPRARISSLSRLPEHVGNTFRLNVRVGDNGEVVQSTSTLTRDGSGVLSGSVGLPYAADAPLGSFRAVLQLPDAPAAQCGRWFVVQESLAAQRERNEDRLNQVEPANDELRRALATCRARNRLLSDLPDQGDSAQFLADAPALASEVRSEIAMLEKGERPYRNKRGEYWRILVGQGVEIPMRVYAPAAAKPDAWPIVIAFHGAGGDEAMFMEGYGAGLIKRLADRHGFLVVCPRTYAFAVNPAALFDDLLIALADDYTIDTKRIYVIGHSMGTAPAAKLAVQRADRVAAACTFAGIAPALGAEKNKSIAPTLVIAAELDAVVSPGAAEQSATKAIAAGYPIEFRKIADYGHTLVVGRTLPEAIEWLWGKTLAGRDSTFSDPARP